jgi:aryl-alcohol dehydrogenase-like predicted oxidoreductase
MTNHRALGDSDIRVAPVALGCMSLCGNMTYDDIPEQQAIDTIHAAIDAGVTLFDTAPMYGDGESERRLGLALRGGKRDGVVVADKVSSNAMRYDEVLRGVETSLRLLQTDRLDLLQIHWASSDVPLDETMRAMEKLLQDGKVRALGVCNFGPTDLANVLEKHRVETNQIPYNLLLRGAEFDLRGLCAERNIGILCYSPLAQGLLTGRYTSADKVPPGRARTRHFAKTRPQARHNEPGCEREMFAAIARVKQVCDQIGKEMADVALAWLLHQPAVACVLAGASRPDQIKQNVEAARIELSPDALKQLDDATNEVKQKLGPNVDPWQTASRIK